ncbi:hypothetical protein C2S42_07895 [Helicobacter pylori]|nr:hypothetical protein C2S42_07895 [Helicobacter pylori]PUB98624.1 hypothetical protein C2S07_03985 [Helicobacter pylori]
MSCIVFHLASCLKQSATYIYYKESLFNALFKKVFVKGFFKYIFLQKFCYTITEIVLRSF